MQGNIDFRYLKAFQLTAKYLNFSKAAKELSIAQSAISRQIKLLEENFGASLILRSSKKVLLTKKGLELYNYINQFDELISGLSRETAKQKIKIGILHGLLENWFLPIIKSFLSETNHQLKVIIGTTEDLMKNLEDGELDIVISPLNYQTDLITSLRLFEEKMVIISKKSIDTKRLEDYDWISYSESAHLSQYANKKSKNILIVESMTAIVELVQLDLGIAIVPEHIIKENHKVIKTAVKLKQKPEIYLSTLNYPSLPKPINDLVKIIKKH